MKKLNLVQTTIFRLALLTLLAAWTVAAAQAEDAQVVITLENVGAIAWKITSVEGAEGIAELDVENPTLNLEVGTRYRFVNHGGINVHPLDFRDADGNFLLAQGSPEGSFEGDEEVNFVADSEGVTFTLTQALADELATYYCTFHPPMVGDIVIAD